MPDRWRNCCRLDRTARCSPPHEAASSPRGHNSRESMGRYGGAFAALTTPEDTSAEAKRSKV